MADETAMAMADVPISKRSIFDLDFMHYPSVVLFMTPHTPPTSKRVITGCPATPFYLYYKRDTSEILARRNITFTMAMDFHERIWPNLTPYKRAGESTQPKYSEK
jgi:hypothetical protein